LEPRALWRHFDQILTIPRGSGNEAAIRQYVADLAEREGLNFVQDSVGNLIVRKPATSGFEQANGTVLQSHLDMVNEKNSNVVHDFRTDPIKPLQIDGFLTADGTTLGSDNGVGIAASLAILESRSIEHGPLEALFTVDEETGLTGASGLTIGLLQGSYLINLDSEEEGALYVGCAGGAGMNLDLLLRSEAATPSHAALNVKIGGLRGGHSGIDIHLQRGNAIVLLARCLYSLAAKQSFGLAELNGGNMHNAIPREAHATVLVDPQARARLIKELKQIFDTVSGEYKSTDPDLYLDLTPAERAAQMLCVEEEAKVLALLCALPHGVTSMSNDIAGLVETSGNLATVSRQGDSLRVHMSNRSSVDSALTGLQQKVEAIGTLAGCATEWVEGYPGWQPNMESPLLSLVRQVHQDVLGYEPEVKAVHAGLECGIIKEKYPEMDVISFGPQIEFPHSPDERVKIESVDGFYRLLSAVIGRLARL
jgi:dipeptidase D